MSAQQYRTKDGDTVDAVCFAFYGSTSGGQVEAVLEANRALGLGDLGPELPAGLIITLPVIAPPATTTISLFS
jgi:phage tail protein X